MIRQECAGCGTGQGGPHLMGGGQQKRSLCAPSSAAGGAALRLPIVMGVRGHSVPLLMALMFAVVLWPATSMSADKAPPAPKERPTANAKKQNQIAKARQEVIWQAISKAAPEWFWFKAYLGFIMAKRDLKPGQLIQLWPTGVQVRGEDTAIEGHTFITSWMISRKTLVKKLGKPKTQSEGSIYMQYLGVQKLIYYSWDGKLELGEGSRSKLQGHDQIEYIRAPVETFTAFFRWRGALRARRPRYLPEARVLRKPFGWIRGIAFSPSGRLLVCVAGHTDDEAMSKEAKNFAQMSLWNVETGKRIRTFSAKLWNIEIGGRTRTISAKEVLRRVCFLSEKRVVTTEGYSGMRIWDVDSGVALQTLAVPKADEAVTWLAVPEAKARDIFVSGDIHSNMIRVWHAGTGKQIRSFGEGGNTLALALSPDGKFAISGDDKGVLRIWQVNSGTVVKRVDAHKPTVNGVAFSPDGLRILSCGDGTAKYWDFRTGKELRRFGGPEAVSAFGLGSIHRAWAFSAKGGHALIGNGFYDLKSGKKLDELALINIPTAKFSLDGKYLAVGSGDGQVLLWQFKRPRRQGEKLPSRSRRYRGVDLPYAMNGQNECRRTFSGLVTYCSAAG